MINQLDSILFNSNDMPKVSNKKTLLIIDDNIEVMEALKVVLNRNYDLITCGSYHEAEKIINDNILVLLLDIKMAYKNGIEVFYLLKSNNPNLKIIFHSAYPGSDENAKLSESLPHNGYLIKGEYDIEELLLTIGKAFN